jgi:hypothetical protein
MCPNAHLSVFLWASPYWIFAVLCACATHLDSNRNTSTLSSVHRLYRKNHSVRKFCRRVADWLRQRSPEHDPLLVPFRSSQGSSIVEDRFLIRLHFQCLSCILFVFRRSSQHMKSPAFQYASLLNPARTRATGFSSNTRNTGEHTLAFTVGMNTLKECARGGDC